MAFSKLGTSPSFVRRSPLEHAPYSVPSVSNISTRQNASAVVIIRITSSADVWLARYAEKSNPCVNTFPKACEPHSPNALNGLKLKLAPNPS